MTPAPFASRELPAEPAWYACADCGDLYDGRFGHACGGAEDPLAPARGMALGFCIAAVVWVLIAVALDLRFGWPL